VIGTWRINAWSAALGAVLTAAINLGRNPIDAAATRALAAAAAFWAIGYALRVLLKQTVPQPDREVGEEAAAGQHLDLSANGEDLNELLLQGLRPPAGGSRQPDGSGGVDASSAPEQQNSGFQPLQPARLKSVPSGMEPDELAQAVRHISREEEQ